MARCVTIRPGGAITGVAMVLGAGVLVATLLGAPGQATAAPPPGARGAVAAAQTSSPPTATTPPTTGPGTPTGVSPTSTSCYTYHTPTPGPGGVYHTWDFEDGTTQGWSAAAPPSGATLPAATVAVTNAVAYDGTRSLRVDGLSPTSGTFFSAGPVPDVEWYKLTAHVRLPAGRPTTGVVLSPQGVRSTIVGRAVAGPGGWTEITAYFMPTVLAADWDCNGTMTGAYMGQPPQVTFGVQALPCGSEAWPATVYVDGVTLARTGTATVPPSSPPAAGCGPTTTPPTPTATCSARYTIVSQWPGGFNAAVELRNLTTAAKPGWTLTWPFQGGEKVTQLWGASTWSQSGATVTVTSATWAGLAANGGTATVGFLGNGTAVVPSTLSLDGSPCTLT